MSLQNNIAELVRAKPLVEGDEKILVLGANGQIGNILRPILEKYYGANVIFADINPGPGIVQLDLSKEGEVEEFIKTKNVKVAINLVALLSAAAQKNPELAKLLERRTLELIEKSDELGLRLVFSPSSIAATTKPRKEGVERWPVATLENDSTPFGQYASTKRKIEQASALQNAKGGATACCLRYAGVLACKVPPSNGTTEEFDKLVIAAAEHQAKVELGLKSEAYKPHIPYSETDPSYLRMPMVDSRTVATETFRFLHEVGRQETKGKEALYHFAEYSATIWEVFGILKTLSPSFNIENAPSVHEQIKIDFASRWPKFTEVEPSMKDWGFTQRFDLTQSVTDQFNRLVSYFRAVHAKDDMQLEPVTARLFEMTTQLVERQLPPNDGARIIFLCHQRLNGSHAAETHKETQQVKPIMEILGTIPILSDKQLILNTALAQHQNSLALAG